MTLVTSSVRSASSLESVPHDLRPRARLTADALMRTGPVIPALVVDDDAKASELALVAGLRVLEVTLRTPAGLGAITAMTEAAQNAMVGAGTVLNADQMKRELVPVVRTVWRHG